MKLSLSSSSYSDHLTQGLTDEKSGFAAIRQCGFTHVDLEIRDDMVEDSFKDRALNLRENLLQQGLTASMAHAPIMNFRGKEEQSRLIYERSLAFCQIAGIPRVVIHPGALPGDSQEQFFDENIRYYHSLLPKAEETGVQILIENIGNYADSYYLWNGQALRDLVDAFSHPLVRACWDVGHANHFWPKDCDQYSSIIALGDRLAALHVHDNCGYFEDDYLHRRIDMHMFPYASFRGLVNFDAVLQALVDIDYQGTFNFETIGPGKTMRFPFEYKGEVVRKLEIPPMEVWTAYNTALYVLGKHMLKTYGVYEV